MKARWYQCSIRCRSILVTKSDQSPPNPPLILADGEIHTTLLQITSEPLIINQIPAPRHRVFRWPRDRTYTVANKRRTFLGSKNHEDEGLLKLFLLRKPRSTGAAVVFAVVIVI
ncbi:hypothetical protein SDJN02_18630, partial [Cucurbita argyrosperma subsp. argyrosperma]